ncbi:hypothetical protein ACWD4L_31900 [Streptomyces sp. NPDC002596]
MTFDRQVSSRTSRLKKITGLADCIDPTGDGISDWYKTQIDISTR